MPMICQELFCMPMILCRHWDNNKIEKQLNIDFLSQVSTLVMIRQNQHSLLLNLKKKKNIKKLIKYRDIQIKQHS